MNSNKFQTEYWRVADTMSTTNVNLITMDQTRSQVPTYDSSRIKQAATKIVQEPQFNHGKPLHVSA